MPEGGLKPWSKRELQKIGGLPETGTYPRFSARGDFLPSSTLGPSLTNQPDDVSQASAKPTTVIHWTRSYLPRGLG